MFPGKKVKESEESSGYEVTMLGDGANALQVFKKSKPRYLRAGCYVAW